MRHRRKNNQLGRTSSHRKAMMSNMATSLILHKRITTTLAKAKELKKFIEPVITRAKTDSTHNRRICFSILSDKKAIAELFREISPKVADRPGGYTRILKTGNRAGDNAEMCIIELVDYNQVMLSAKEEKAGKTTRRRRAPGKKKAGEEKGEVKTKKTAKKEDKPAEELPAAEENVTEVKAETESPAAEEPKEEKMDDASETKE
jgi:large subunit ribosomal protein L17